MDVWKVVITIPNIISEDQFRGLIERNGDSVYKIAFSYLRNKEDADDAFQEVFLKYMTDRREFADETHERAWFIRVTINVCHMHHRSFWFRKRAAFDAFDDKGKEDEYTFELLHSVMKLSSKLRVTVYLFYYEGYSVREISDILGVNENTVRSRLMQARKKLKGMLAEDGQPTCITQSSAKGIEKSYCLQK
jgi:RNA polymerase sigma-70 factor (ECF subfamily)